jgi:hypothetical protein
MNEVLKRISNTSDGKILSEYILDKIKELDSSITDLTNPIEIAIEMKGRVNGIIKLKEIFNDLNFAKEEMPEVFDKREYAVVVDN